MRESNLYLMFFFKDNIDIVFIFSTCIVVKIKDNNKFRNNNNSLHLHNTLVESS